jgi:hypothetical protein
MVVLVMVGLLILLAVALLITSSGGGAAERGYNLDHLYPQWVDVATADWP